MKGFPDTTIYDLAKRAETPTPKDWRRHRTSCCGVQERLRKKLLWSLQVAKAVGAVWHSFMKKLFFCVSVSGRVRETGSRRRLPAQSGRRGLAQDADT